jgi:hypothetical protein
MKLEVLHRPMLRPAGTRGGVFVFFYRCCVPLGRGVLGSTEEKTGSRSLLVANVGSNKTFVHSAEECRVR